MDKIIEAMRAQGATEADIEAYVRSVGGVDVTRPKPRGFRTPAQIERLNRNDVAASRTRLDDLGAMAQSFADAATFGLAGLATDALSGGSFRANRDLRKSSRDALSGTDRFLSGLAGGLASPVGAVLGPARAGAGMLRTIGKGILEGGVQGAAMGVGENIGTTADPSGAIHGIGGLLAGAPIGGAFAGVGYRVARRGGDAAAEAAARRAQAAAETDAKLGHRSGEPPLGPGMPVPLEIDLAGPTMLAHARGAAKSIGGREAFRGPFAAREAAMPTAITGDIPDATLLEGSLRKSRSAEGRRLYREAVEATQGQPVESEALAALMQSPAGRLAWSSAKYARENRVASMGDMAADSRRLPTREVPVEVEFGPPPASAPVRTERGGLRRNLKEVSTDDLEAEWRRLAALVGDDELSVAHRELPEWAAYRELPRTERLGARGREDLPTGDDMFDPDDLAALNKAESSYNRREIVRRAYGKAMDRIRAEIDSRSTSITPRELSGASEVVEVPDAEAIQHMIRFLRRIARGGQGQVAATGIKAEDAADALALLNRVKDELPEPFKVANRAWADASAKIRTVQEGRRPASPNPMPTRSGLPSRPSLSELEQQVAGMTPERRELFRRGKLHDLASRIRERRLTPESAAKALLDPQSTLARELNLAGGGLGPRLSAWNDVLERQRGLLSGPGPAMEPATGGVMTTVSESAAPTLWWTLIKGARNAFGQTAAKTAARRSAEDAAFAAILSGRRGKLEAALKALAKLDAERGATAAAASARAGRVGGLLFR